MALSESAGQRPALLRPAQGRDDRAYWHELFGSLEVVHFFLVTARCGCFMQAARSLDVKPTLLRKTLARLEERLGLHLFVHEGNALSLTREGRIVQAAGQRLVEDSQSHADLHRQQPLVRLAVAESVLHDVLSRELWGYLRKNANLRVALAELREGWPESAGPAEIAIWIADPGQPHPPMEGHFAAPARIAELEYQPHIGKRYSRERTRPASEDELDDYLLAQLHGHAASAALEPAGGGSPVGSDRGAEPRPAATGDPLGRLHRPAAALRRTPGAQPGGVAAGLRRADAAGSLDERAAGSGEPRGGACLARSDRARLRRPARLVRTLTLRA